jgi:hypothetical protein
MLRWLKIAARAKSIRSLLNELHPKGTGHPLVRFGPHSDGGYIIPDDLEGIVACFSPGVCETSGFELDCANRGIPVFLADASVSAPAATSPLFHFTKKFLGRDSHGDFLTLSDWVQQSIGDHAGDLMLQMDIEGFEYEVIEATTPSLLQRFRIIVVEFHNLCAILNGGEKKWREIQKSLKKLMQTHVCVHAHPNNISRVGRFRDIEIPDLMELTFLRRDRVTTGGYRKDFPHHLDFPNNSQHPDQNLPACWWRS